MVAAARSVLLTGFGPFPGVADNVTALLVPELAARASAAVPECTFHHDVLDTAWGAAPGRAARLIARHRPVLALHFGVAREACGFRIERTAQNLCRSAADVTGCLPATTHLDSMGPETRATSLDTAQLTRRLAQLGYPVSISDDAGAYLCNAVLYHSLAATEALAGHRCQAGFIHLPADLSGPPLTFQDALEGSLEIIRACLATIDGLPES